MKFIRSSLLILSLVLLQSVYAASKGLKVKVNLSPAGSFEIATKRIKGKASRSGGGFVASNVYVSVKSLKTGMDLRDKHLHDKLEKSKYPKISILQGKAKGGNGVATIQVKNIKKKIKFKYKEVGGSLKILFNLNLKDFNFKGIKYMGVGVKDKVKVEALVPIK